MSSALVGRQFVQTPRARRAEVHLDKIKKGLSRADAVDPLATFPEVVTRCSEGPGDRRIRPQDFVDQREQKKVGLTKRRTCYLFSLYILNDHETGNGEYFITANSSLSWCWQSGDVCPIRPISRAVPAPVALPSRPNAAESAQWPGSSGSSGLSFQRLLAARRRSLSWWPGHSLLILTKQE